MSTQPSRPPILGRPELLRYVASWPHERIVALTIYGEIRGGTEAQKLNVANVIRNRVRAQIRSDGGPDWFGEGWDGVCLARAQFSCWWDQQQPRMTALPETDGKYQECLAIARRVMSGTEPDTTQGSTNYHTIARPGYAKTWPPAWGELLNHKTISDGLHVFYRDPAARFIDDVAQVTPPSVTGPATALAAGAGGVAWNWLASLSPETLTGWWAALRPISEFAIGNWKPVALGLGAVSMVLGARWLYMRWLTQRAIGQR